MNRFRWWELFCLKCYEKCSTLRYLGDWFWSGGQTCTSSQSQRGPGNLWFARIQCWIYHLLTEALFRWKFKPQLCELWAILWLAQTIRHRLFLIRFAQNIWDVFASSSKDKVGILNFTTRVHWSISPAFWTTARRKSTRLIMLKSNFSQIFSYRRLCGSSPILQQATNNKFRRWLRMVWYPWSSPTCQGSYPWSFWSPALQFQSNVRGEFQTQKEAAWAISNLTISGNKTQVALLFWLRLYRVALKCQLKKSSWCNI